MVGGLRKIPLPTSASQPSILRRADGLLFSFGATLAPVQPAARFALHWLNRLMVGKHGLLGSRQRFAAVPVTCLDCGMDVSSPLSAHDGPANGVA